MGSLHAMGLLGLALGGVAGQVAGVPRSGLVWPPPKSITTSGPAIPLAPSFAIVVAGSSASGAGASEFGAAPRSGRLARAVRRYHLLVAPARTVGRRTTAAAAANTANAAVVVGRLVIMLDSSDTVDDAVPGLETLHNYTLSVGTTGRGGGDRTAGAAGGGVDGVIRAGSVDAAMYGMETFAQLVDVEQGVLTASAIHVVDAPDYPWRGLLVDTGRRFAPIALLENIIDTMAAVKMNVLHLHASDFCRFGVQSHIFPNLTAGLRPANAGFYTQNQVRALVGYAADRGVRVVPEFEMPAHASGFWNVVSEGIEFCQTCAYGTCTPSQLHGSDATFRVLHAVLGEMAALFPDPVFHVGADETFVTSGRCDLNNTAWLERKVVAAVANEFGKTPAGWEQVLFKTEAATKETIVYAYMGNSSVVNTTKTGHRVVNANNMYFTVAAPGGPAGWSPLWFDMAQQVPVAEKKLVLGGEMSMWTDTYCSPRECGAMPPYHTEVGAALYARARDVEYGRSLGGMIWPRGFVGAAAFWNYNASTDAAAAPFVNGIWTVNDGLQKRGSLVCPSRCSCNQTTACGRPYFSGA